MQKMILGLLFILFGVTPAQAQNLMLSGTCPGPIDNRMMGMTANSPVMVMESRFAGSGTLTTGPCAGTVTNLATPAGISGGLSNAGGFLMTTTVTPPYKCGNWRQAIDLTTCALTPPRRTPDIIDDDGDGFPIPFDCDDSDASIYPGAWDIPMDGIDQDCDGVDSGVLATFTGIQTDLPESALTGWTECYRDYYSDDGTPMVDIQAACASTSLIVACRETGSSILQVAAQGNFEDVFFDTGTGNVGHEANGVEWYYNDSYSWGYVEPGDGMSRNSCDTETGSYPEHRLCFHTGSGNINGGWRCGVDTSTWDTNWERVVYSANGVDADGDGFDEFSDCNDADGTIYPGAPEVFGDGIDQDCDGVDENDADGDGWSDIDGDCDDTDAAVNPGATEIYSDGIDNDCDGLAPNDDDGDGWTDLDGDCDDSDYYVNPGIAEIYGDGIDNDCDGLAPNDDDSDGWTDLDGDCDDGDASIYPGAKDIPLDGIDQDCNGWDEGEMATFTGIQTDLPESALAGWTECYRDYYSDDGTPMVDIQAACAGTALIVACRETGSSILQVAAQGNFEDVFFDTGTGNVGHEANGVEWYYNDSYSWGYVEPGDGMSRNSCDTETGSYPEHRLCFHTGSGNINGGWRCGVDTSTWDTNWERVVYSANGVDADGDGTPLPWDCDDDDAFSTVVADDADCDGLPTAEDCDDSDPTSPAIADDADCDGLATADDCDDADPYMNGDDADGDGVSTCEGDPDDDDPDVTSDVCPAGYALAFDIEDDFSDQIPNDCAWLWDSLFSQGTHISLEWFGVDGIHFGPSTWDLSVDYAAIESAYSGCSGSNYDLPDETGTYWMTLVQINDLLHIQAAGDSAADGTDFYYGRISAMHTEADEIYAVGFDDWADAWSNSNQAGDRFIACYAP